MNSNRASRWSVPALAAFALLAWLTPVACAQTAPPSATFRTLGIGADVSDVFYDLGGKPVPLTATEAGLSLPYDVPAGGRVVLYCWQPSEVPGEKARRVVLGDVRMDEGGPFLVFIAARPGAVGEIEVRVAEDSWKTHPAETIRLFNFSRRDVAARIVIKEVVVELAPGKDRVLPYPAIGQFWMQAATREREGWVIRVSAPQVAPPKARITAIIFDEQPSVDRPVTHELHLVKFIDVEPPSS